MGHRDKKAGTSVEDRLGLHDSFSEPASCHEIVGIPGVHSKTAGVQLQRPPEGAIGSIPLPAVKRQNGALDRMGVRVEIVDRQAFGDRLLGARHRRLGSLTRDDLEHECLRQGPMSIGIARIVDGGLFETRNRPLNARR